MSVSSRSNLLARKPPRPLTLSRLLHPLSSRSVETRNGNKISTFAQKERISTINTVKILLKILGFSKCLLVITVVPMRRGVRSATGCAECRARHVGSTRSQAVDSSDCSPHDRSSVMKLSLYACDAANASPLASMAENSSGAKMSLAIADPASTDMLNLIRIVWLSTILRMAALQFKT